MCGSGGGANLKGPHEEGEKENGFQHRVSFAIQAEGAGLFASVHSTKVVDTYFPVCLWAKSCVVLDELVLMRVSYLDKIITRLYSVFEVVLY